MKIIDIYLAHFLKLRDFPIEAILAVLGSIFVFSACEPNGTPLQGNVTEPDKIIAMYEEYREDFPGIGEISAHELAGKLADKEDLVIVDVRESEEREVSTIPGSISKEEFEKKRDVFQDQTIVVHCTIGYRSGMYVQELAEQGIEAYNLKGSILSWVHEGQPVVDAEGNVTKRVHVYGKKWDLLPEGYEAVW